MPALSFDSSFAKKFLDESKLQKWEKMIPEKFSEIYSGQGAGNDFLGWVTLPSSIKDEDLKSMQKHADEFSSKCKVAVVIGIGGSYLGTRAVKELLIHSFSSMLGIEKTELLYAGNNISQDYLCDLLDVLDKKDYGIIVISKSGTTTEPAVAFRLLRKHIEEKYGKEEAAKRIVAITDSDKGALRQLSESEGYKTYSIPGDVGGRYSVLTPVGLFPLAVSGIDITKLVNGARDFENYCKEEQSEKNIAGQYAAVRNALYENGKHIEVMASFLPSMRFFTEWWKQLFGESEGKDGKGIFPASVIFSTDLHSMGQLMQDGMRNMFETVISVHKAHREVLIPEEKENLDGLNYLAGKPLTHLNIQAEKATRIAHVDGGVPNLTISFEETSEEVIGELIYFFEISCAISGYMLEVNPFDQPGVEDYKKNMFALLGKPGFENRLAELNELN